MSVIRRCQSRCATCSGCFLPCATKYREGLIEFSDMLTTEQNLLTAQNNLAASGGTVYRNIITFYKAVGGGY